MKNKFVLLFIAIAASLSAANAVYNDSEIIPIAEAHFETAAKIADLNGYLFADQPQGVAYMRGRADAYREAAEYLRANTIQQPPMVPTNSNTQQE